MDFEHLCNLVDKALEAQQDYIKSLADLTTKSEARIDRTNEIVYKLTLLADKNQDVVTTLTKEYSKHLGALASCRDSLIEQNRMLIKLHEQDVADKREMRAQINDNANKIFALLNKMSTHQGQGVKVENKFQDKI